MTTINSNMECPVCMEPTQLCDLSPCNHQMCNNCFRQLATKVCPLCRCKIKKVTCSNNIVYPPNSNHIIDILGDQWTQTIRGRYPRFEYILSDEPTLTLHQNTQISDLGFAYIIYKMSLTRDDDEKKWVLAPRVNM